MAATVKTPTAVSSRDARRLRGPGRRARDRERDGEAAEPGRKPEKRGERHAAEGRVRDAGAHERETPEHDEEGKRPAEKPRQRSGEERPLEERVAEELDHGAAP